MTEKNTAISTGSIQLDAILGGDGIPPGSIIEIFGEQGTGKTTLALELIQSVQSRDGQAAYVDAEHSVNVDYARRIGVRPEQLLFAQPDTGEEGLDIARELAGSGSLDLIVVDSAAALVPGREVNRDYDVDTTPDQAQMLSKALRKLSPDVKRTGTVLCFTNQVRSRLNRPVGPDETTPGGNALKFYTAIRIRLEQVSSIEREDTVIGRRIRSRVVKNRAAPPDRSVVLDLLFDRGICPYGDLLDAGLAYDVIERRSSGFRFNEHQLGTNRQELRDTLNQRPDLCRALRERIRSSRGDGASDPFK